MVRIYGAIGRGRCCAESSIDAVLIILSNVLHVGSECCHGGLEGLGSLPLQVLAVVPGVGSNLGSPGRRPGTSCIGAGDTQSKDHEGLEEHEEEKSFEHRKYLMIPGRNCVQKHRRPWHRKTVGSGARSLKKAGPAIK